MPTTRRPPSSQRRRLQGLLAIESARKPPNLRAAFPPEPHIGPRGASSKCSGGEGPGLSLRGRPQPERAQGEAAEVPRGRARVGAEGQIVVGAARRIHETPPHHVGPRSRSRAYRTPAPAPRNAR